MSISVPRWLRGPACVTVAAIAAAATAGEAHKPITSPYTFNEHVFPILRDHCGRCHVAGGVAPMPLTTHQETVPWGESMRLELIAGHMPPWTAESSAGRLRHSNGLTARELNTLLTWASGGTPPGDDTTSTPPALDRRWPLGAPDVVIPLPEFTLTADQQEKTAEFVVPAGQRVLRAIDLLPGTPSIVRSATVSTRTGQVLSWWQPGDEPVALDGAAFHLPSNAELIVTVRYRKTWEFERQEMRDRSAIGLYLGDASQPAVATMSVVLPGLVLERGLRVLAVTPDAALAEADVRVDAIRPDGSRETLIAFRPAAGWSRRYWFERPVVLPAGTRIGISTSAAGEVRPRVLLDAAPM